MGWIVRKLFVALIIFFLPFILLIRGSIFLHNHFEYNPCFSLLGGMIATLVILFIYFTLIYGKFSKRPRRRSLLWMFYIAFLIVLAFCIHGLLFISGNNFKRPDLRNEFTQLHPILRMGISTLVHMDRSLIITDAARVPEDYQKMGLRSKAESLHYKQKNGYVHAVDLRTNDRKEIRNWIITAYFKLMGFRTLRHDETGDHLHISIKCHEKPWAI